MGSSAEGMEEDTALVGTSQAAGRLDRVLAEIFALSRSRLKALIEEGRVALDGTVVRDPARRVAAGAQVRLELPPARDPVPVAQDLPLVVVHEDDDLIVLDKPAGLVVHPAPGHERGTLVNALIAHCGASLSGVGGVRRPGIVHRLDRDTSGLIVVAKNDHTHQGLAAQFAAHGRDGALARAYLALVWGRPEPAAGAVDAPLARSTRNREKIAVVAPGQGRHAVTHYRTQERLAGEAVTLLRCTLETGRTHQIRVHMAHGGHPLLGDATYGAGFRTKAARLNPGAQAALERLGRQALHAALLGFRHPRTGETLRFESAAPPELADLIAALRAAG
jgi:23S rRNA pseudouridine1911/1915/1917 synthase